MCIMYLMIDKDFLGISKLQIQMGTVIISLLTRRMFSLMSCKCALWLRPFSFTVLRMSILISQRT